MRGETEICTESTWMKWKRQKFLKFLEAINMICMAGLVEGFFFFFIYNRIALFHFFFS